MRTRAPRFPGSLARISLGALGALVLLVSCASERARRDASGAEEGFDLAADRGPSVKTLHAMAHVLAAQGKDGECELVLNKLIGEHPSFLPAYNELSELYLRHERIDSALEVLRAGLRRDPSDPVLLNNLGMCHVLRGEYPAALEQFTAAAARVPEDGRSRANMAVALGMLGRMDEALALYMQVLSPADAHHNLGVLLTSRGDPEGAAREYALAEELQSRERKRD